MSTASPARIEANRRNSLKSSGPKTEAGKAASRGNALKHGLACETIAATAADAREVEQRSRALAVELRAVGVMQRALVARIALLSVRLERCAEQETASLADRVQQAFDEFDARTDNQDDDPRTRAQERAWAGDRALFDPSKEASLARRHEAAAERGLYRALRELRTLQAAEKTEPEPPVPRAKIEAEQAALASFRQATAALAKAEPGAILPVASAPKPTPKPPVEPVAATNLARLNRRQRRAALAKRG